MKKLILTSVTVLFVSATVLSISLTSFAKDNTKHIKKCNEKYDQKEFLEQKRIFMLRGTERVPVDTTMDC